MGSVRFLSKKIALFCFVLFLGLAFFELAVRVVSPQPPPAGWYQRSERYGVVLKPNYSQSWKPPHKVETIHIRTNANGFRDIEHSLRDGTRRITLLGDSYVFGSGVNTHDRFDAHLRKGLEAETHPAHQVFNLGVPGWGTKQALLFIENEFETYAPDVIVLTVCGNDPRNNNLFDQGLSGHGQGTTPILSQLKQHSHAYRLVFVRLFAIYHHYSSRKSVEMDPDAYLDEQTQEYLTQEDLDKTARHIASFRETFLKRNPDGMLILQLTNPLQDQLRACILPLHDGKHVFFNDWSDTMREVPVDRRQVSDEDSHWSSEVHREVAGSILEILEGIQP